ncbi:hypothetical protein [Pusillimonas sp.]|uniref:hypothetical protein n=1 Tax=Pusillimonas sp. TaxID=3040095 RepID=UPI0037CA8F49
MFSSARADYYEFLSASMQSARGRHSLRDVFERDARRYAGTARGRLAASWSRIYAESGGDLYATWSGCFPASELALIRVAQISGNEALVHTLRDLAHVAGLARHSRHILRATIRSGVLSLCVLAATILAVPLFTVPRLASLFEALPVEYFGSRTRALFGFAAVVESAWPPAAIVLILGAVAVGWSVANLTGPLRRLLDHCSIWRIHRCLSALGFMSFLAVLLQRRDASSTQLRTALAMLCVGASPWMRGHLDGMLGRIDHGVVGAETFDTGLLDRELYWYLQDMADARGLVDALMLLRDRLDGRVLPQVARQAQTLRWSLLACCVTGMLALGLWHYAVIDELRRSLMIFYASQ